MTRLCYLNQPQAALQHRPRAAAGLQAPLPGPGSRRLASMSALGDPKNLLLQRGTRVQPTSPTRHVAPSADPAALGLPTCRGMNHDA